MTKHPDELTLLRMVDGELPRERVSSTRTHIVDCAHCQAAYESLKTETELIRATLREDEEPLPEAYRRQEEIGAPLRRTEDAREAQRAFVEKRRPIWQGR